MAYVIIGIQGDFGSANERAAKYFAKEQNFINPKIVPLHTTHAVLTALHAKKIDYGTFAWESSRAGLVEETQQAVAKFTYQKISEVSLQIDHALLINSQIDPNQTVNIYSHPQALKEHKDYLEKTFQKVQLLSELDTAYAARQLKAGAYPVNSLVIAPVGCAELYGLNIFEQSLPGNQGYMTKFYLVKI